MIPRRIKLVNFLSYRQCELDLSGLRLAVLSGRNGDGKSALLDAMTWAVWGKGRGRTDDDRIRSNAGHVSVEFEFESQGHTYRVVRKRTRGGAGQIDFFQLRDDGWAAVTGGVQRETQAEIIRRLHMDFETFENSAFIAQGRANEFTKRTPRERKDVFRKILGLGIYEELSIAANDRRKEVEGESRSLLARIEEATGSIEELPDVEEAIARSGCEIDAVKCHVADLERAVGDLRELSAVHERLVRQFDDETRREQETAAAITRDQQSLAEAGVEMVQTREALTGEPALEAQHVELVAFRKEESVLSVAMTEVRRIEGEIAAASAEIGAEQAALQSRRNSLERETGERQKAAAAADALRETATAFEAREREIAALREEARAALEAATKARELRAAAESTAEQCKEQNRELHEKREELLKVQKEGGESICPVCRQALDPKDLKHVLDEYTAQKKDLGDRYALALAEAMRAAAGADAAEKKGTKLDSEARDMERTLASQRESVAAGLAVAEESERVLPGLLAEVAAIETQLEAESYATVARARRAELENCLQKTGYDAHRHAEVRSAIADLEHVEDCLRQLATARERLDGLIRRKDDLEARLVALGADHARWLDALASTKADLESAEDVAPRLREVESDLAAGRQRQADLQMTLGRYTEREKQLRALAARTEEARAQAMAFIEEQGLYKDLAHAFSRDGVQAMLMEQALPRLQQIANAMLDRMTGGRISVQLRTQKTGKAGNVQETLDILISDDLGTRDYEMYSGGEAFRVDFALRIALAKLLAERAGAELPTLIIDEGFGSQDEDGIDRLVDAINSVSEEFRLILVVTHVDEMRGRFEQRIEVSKDPERGSFARVA